jgi:hypothetical protein
MKLSVRRLFHLTERDKSNIVWLADFFKRPAYAHITR